MDDNPVSRIVEPVARVAAIACGYVILAVAIATGVEIIGRKLFNFSLQGVDDYGGYTLAITAAIGACYTMARRGHTRIDVFLVRMPHGLQAALNVIAMVSLAAFAAFAAWRGWSVLAETIEFKSVSSTPAQTPLWIPQTVWFGGLALFAVFAVAYSVHAIVCMTRGPARVNRLYGPHTVEQEVEEELAARSVHTAPGERR